jgi:acylphosphatase/archaellum component FlaC
MDKQAEIIIHGRVQKAGFRDFIDEMAFNLSLNGYVKNLDDGTVHVICEGEETEIKELVEKINIKQYPISVEKIDVTYKSPTREFKTFEIIRDEDIAIATYDRMDAAARYMREMNTNLSQKIDGLGDRLGDKIDGLGNKIDGLGNKIDGIGNKIDGIGNKIDGLGNKIDGLGNKIDLNREEITGEIHSLRDDLKSHFDERLTKMESELFEIKSRVDTIQYLSLSKINSKSEGQKTR